MEKIYKGYGHGRAVPFEATIDFSAGTCKCNCETQEEVDEFWEKLSAGGEKQQCGWLRDKFGVTWQIVPTILDKLLQDKDPEKSAKVMQAMMKMDKPDIQRLHQAYDQK